MNLVKAKIKPDCDWIIGSLKGLETARSAEMSGLLTAKEYLVRAKMRFLSCAWVIFQSLVVVIVERKVPSRMELP